MSISRKNWSALSTLTRQWTVEDEEEVEREKRRKERGSSTTVDPDESPDKEAEPHTSSVSGSADVGESGENSGGGLDQLQMDFVEMLRVRDERRRVRLVETLRKNKEGEGGTMEDSLDGETHVELTGEKRDEGHREKVQRCVEALMSPEPSVNPEKNEKSENASNQNSTSVTPTKSSRKFVSSLSISFDKSPSSPPATSRGVSPLSPKSPPSQHPEGSPYSPFSPTHSDTLSPTLNGNTEGQENGTPSNFEPATKPAFTRQSSRTISFRMMRKKEEDSMPLQRSPNFINSASVRIATKTFESNKSPDQEDEQKSPFQRNSRQRISSRSIQEKMERLAQASQKWEMAKSPTLLKTGCLADEVSRKRELFEKEEEKSHIFSTQFQDFRNFSSGISGRINQWVQNKTFTLSHSPSDLRHVNISSKKSLFEKGAEQEHK